MCGGDEDTAMAMIRNEVDKERRAHMRKHRKHLTDADIAALVGVSPQYLSDLMSGRRRVSAIVAARMYNLGWAGDEIYQRQAVMDFDRAWPSVPLGRRWQSSGNSEALESVNASSQEV
jgi:transcriptional regulator with XRE-family HTH domain